VSDDVLLELRDVSVRYGSFEALSNVSYRVRHGQMVCLLGGNASGKSTSMKAVFGVVALSSGEVRWCGQPITSWSTERRVRAGLAAVPEGRRVFARLTVEENLLSGAYNRTDADAVRQDLGELYERFPRLADRRLQLAGTMSGGEQQMVAIARALMSRPQLVCMDEPSMGLAPALVRQCFELIAEIRARGTAVFVVEQNANAALRIADYAYVLETGRVLLEGTAAEVAADPAMRAAYLGRPVEEAT